MLVVHCRSLYLLLSLILLFPILFSCFFKLIFHSPCHVFSRVFPPFCASSALPFFFFYVMTWFYSSFPFWALLVHFFFKTFCCIISFSSCFIFVFSSCFIKAQKITCNKLSHILWPKRTHIHYLTVLEVRSLTWISLGWNHVVGTPGSLSGGSWGESPFSHPSQLLEAAFCDSGSLSSTFRASRGRSSPSHITEPHLLPALPSLLSSSPFFFRNIFYIYIYIFKRVYHSTVFTFFWWILCKSKISFVHLPYLFFFFSF